jgi:hypothetical protein
MKALIAISILVALSVVSAARAQPGECGMAHTDWCPSPAGDPCGRHKTKAACMADRACVGMRYRGESVIACMWDARGFAPNCPTVGCVSAPKK